MLFYKVKMHNQALLVLIFVFLKHKMQWNIILQVQNWINIRRIVKIMIYGIIIILRYFIRFNHFIMFINPHSQILLAEKNCGRRATLKGWVIFFRSLKNNWAEFHSQLCWTEIVSFSLVKTSWHQDVFLCETW